MKTTVRIAVALALACGAARADTDVKDCAPGESLEMEQAIEWGADHWKEYEPVLEKAADVNIKNCLENRFKKNGKIVCEKDQGGMCSDRDGNNNGWASALNKRCHMYPSFLNRVKGMTGPDNKANRKACYFALITHEWAHTCERSHKSIEILDDTAFDFWKDKHSDVTISLSSCGMS